MRLTPFVVYDRTTGRIERSGFALPNQIAIQATEPRLAVLAGVGFDGCDVTQFVQDGRMVARPVIAQPAIIGIKAGGVDKAVLSGLPDPVTVSVDGKPQTVKGGVLVLASLMPATYRLKSEQWPFMPWAGEVQVR